LQAEKPSVFFETLRQMAQLNTWFPEVAKLMDVPQNPRYHGEGNVWNHTMLVLDAAVGYRSKAQQPFGFMLAALVHDFGKILCTQGKEGEIHAYGHETEGLPIVRQFLRRLTRDKALIRYVENLVALHGKPGILAAAKASVKATNRMFDQAQAPEDLLALSAADHQGQILAQPRASAQPFLQQRLAVYREMMGRPYVTGKDLIAAGLTPDAQFSQLLRYAHQLRLAGVEKESALKQTLRQRAAKLTKK
jgi:tRNA nucleotidyltransferase (CCA-adding enzyme)